MITATLSKDEKLTDEEKKCLKRRENIRLHLMKIPLS